jgi:hypothetical protein
MVSPTSLLVPPLPRFSQRDLPNPEIDGLAVGHSYTVYARALNGAVDPSQFDNAVVSLLPEYG